MKNVLVCSSCSHENPFYLLNCEKCTAFLRPRNPNINLWETIWKLFDTPITTSEKIVQSEHKNFLIPFLIIIAFKYSLICMIFNNVFKYKGGKATDIQNNFFFGGLTVILLLIVFSFIITYINRFAGIKNRFKDNLSLYAYSFTPQIFAMLILIPVEFALFGEYWFTFNPSPFLIKPVAAYMLFAIETIMFLWTSMLFIMSTYAQTRNKIYSSVVGVSLSVLIILTLLFA